MLFSDSANVSPEVLHHLAEENIDFQLGKPSSYTQAGQSKIPMYFKLTKV
jgi:hypothetical protein